MVVATASNWFLYIIETECGLLYTGISTNVQRRFKEHQKDKKKAAKFFRGRKPKAVVYQISCANRSEASQLECKIKKLSRLQKQQLIKNSDDLRPS